jgi:predicted acyltransferase
MKRIERIVESYWIGYYIVFAAGVAILLYRHNWTLAQWDDVDLLGDVFSTAGGEALLVVIIVEVLGRMVLLIPKTVKAILEKGREEERRRILEAYRDAVARGDIDGGPEIEEVLFGAVGKKRPDSK